MLAWMKQLTLVLNTLLSPQMLDDRVPATKAQSEQCESPLVDVCTQDGVCHRARLDACSGSGR